MLHFFAADVLGVFVAFLLGIPILLLPGFAIGRALNLLDFKNQSGNSKWLLSLVVGISVVPLLAYLAFRLMSQKAEICFLLGLAAWGAYAAISDRAVVYVRRIPKGAVWAAAGWVVLASLLSFDVVAGSALFPSSSVIDTSMRARVIAAINHSTHLPPANPFYFDPAHESTLQYHYFLFVAAAAIEKCGAGIVTATTSLIAVTVWVGFAFLGIFGVLVSKRKSARVGKSRSVVWLLPLIGGLDILPVGVEILTRWRLGQSPYPAPDIEWWNAQGQVFAWLDTAVWHPHHLASLCAGLLACLILWESRDENLNQRLKSCFGAALCLAASAGLSALVAIIFIIYLAIVTVELFLNAPRHAAFLAFTGAMSLVLIWPFLHEVHGAAGGGTGTGFDFIVRPFSPTDAILTTMGIRSAAAWNAVRLLSLPLNYLLELGFFFVVGIWWLYEYKQAQREKDFGAHLEISLVVLSIAMVSFVSYGTIAANDFGYRAILPAQFVLMLWAADLVQRDGMTVQPGRRRIRQVAKVAALLGIGSTVLGCVMMRTSIGITSAGLDLYYGPLRGPHSAERLYDLRESYSWIRRNTPLNAIVQESPLTFESLSAQYGERRTARESWFEGDSFVRNGGNSSPVFDNALKLFVPGTEQATKNEACRHGGIDYVVVKDNDAIWFDRHSYVWTEKPVYAAGRVRVFGCQSK